MTKKIFAYLCLFCLCACGVKGDLYLPKKTKDAAKQSDSQTPQQEK